MKHKLGDIITYSNKNEKLDIIGTIISSHGMGYYCVEASGGTIDHPHLSHIISPVNYPHLSEHFTENSFHSLRTKSNKCYWVPKRSKNLYPGFKEYNPSQNGDTDDDI